MINSLENIILKSSLSNDDKLFWEKNILPNLNPILISDLVNELNEYPNLLPFYTKNFIDTMGTKDYSKLSANYDLILEKIENGK